MSAVPPGELCDSIKSKTPLAFWKFVYSTPVQSVQHIASVINFPFVSWLLLCRKWVAPQLRSGTPFMPWKWACVLQSGHIEIDSHVQLIGASLAVMTCLIRDCIGEG